MPLTVAELALAIGMDENYVRQHIRRKNLRAGKDGRRVFIEEAEAARWAKERGLPFSQATGTLEFGDEVSTRAARITMLAILGTDGTSRNVFTLIRHRDRRSLGPWDKEEDLSWHCATVPVENAGETKGLSFYRYDGMWTDCQEFVDRILREGKLDIEGHEVQFTLESKPQRHWAFQEHTSSGAEPLNSPFSSSSAEITEYWCFDPETQERWITGLQASEEAAQKMVDALHFPINKRSDRVGNLMIARALDAVESEIASRHDNRLILRVASRDWAEPPPGAYSATVWADYSGDKVIHQSIEISNSETVLDHESDIDLVGYEINRSSDGVCINRYEAHLIKEINFQIAMSGPPTELSIHVPRRGYSIKRQMDTNSIASTFSVASDDSDGLDQAIRKKHLVHVARETDRAARNEGSLYRFGPDQVDEAVEHIAQLVRAKANSEGPIYFSDPHLSGESQTELKVLMAILAGANGRPLYILSGRWKNSLRINRTLPLIEQAKVRNVTGADGRGKPAFHDRYLITPAGETLITNSVNGWESDGVTFDSHSYGVYRAEAEKFWSLNAGVNGNDILVEEVDPWKGQA